MHKSQIEEITLYLFPNNITNFINYTIHKVSNKIKKNKKINASNEQRSFTKAHRNH